MEYSGNCAEFSAGKGTGNMVGEEAKEVRWDQMVKGLECHPKESGFHPVENDASGTI